MWVTVRSRADRPMAELEYLPTRHTQSSGRLVHQDDTTRNRQLLPCGLLSISAVKPLWCQRCTRLRPIPTSLFPLIDKFSACFYVTSFSPNDSKTGYHIVILETRSVTTFPRTIFHPVANLIQESLLCISKPERASSLTTYDDCTGRATSSAEKTTHGGRWTRPASGYQ